MILGRLTKSGTSLLLLLGIIVISFLRIASLNASELTSDNAIYSFRALGWVDYIGGSQIGPMQLVGENPLWGMFSFQDAPPLVFFIQHLFFEIFGDRVIVAKLPFVIAGLLTIFAIFYFVQRIKDRETAVLASLMLGVSSYASWTSRSGYLEGIESFFILLTFSAMVLYVHNNNDKTWLYWGSFFLGLSVLSKYTAIFLIPALLVFFLSHRTRPSITLKKMDTWNVALQIFIGTISPIIVYNFFLYNFRGHFDSALSAIVGLHSDDFGVIDSRGVDLHIGQNCVDFLNSFYDSSSFPFAFLFTISITWLFVKLLSRRADVMEQALSLSIFFILVMFSLFSGGTRFHSIVLPFLCIASALLIIDIKDWIKSINNRKIERILLTHLEFLLSIILIFEIFYNINTNILSKPLGTAGLYYSTYRQENEGFNQLDDFLQIYRKNYFSSEHSRVSPIKTATELHLSTEELAKSESVLLYDERTSWFAGIWYFERYKIYYRLPVVSTAGLYFTSIGKLKEYFSMRYTQVRVVFLVYPTTQATLDPVKMSDPYYSSTEELVSDLERKKYPYVRINTSSGQEAFRVYRIDLK